MHLDTADKNFCYQLRTHQMEVTREEVLKYTKWSQNVCALTG